MAKVSIVAPVYGVEKYIDQFLQSIREQTLQDLEVILVDDGSPDNCPAILDAFAATDSRYTVIHQKNGGVSRARNTGLAAVTGDYVYIVDSDDWLTPDAVEKLYDAAVSTGADIIYGDWIEEFPSGRADKIVCFPKPFVTEDPATISAMQCAVFSNNYGLDIKTKDFDSIGHMGGAPWRVMFRTSVIKENHLEFDPYVRGLGDDILFTLHVYEHAKKIAYIQHPIYHYREVAVSYSHGYKANYLEAVGLIYEHMEKFLRDYGKNETTWSFYYYRVLIYFTQGMARYFKNSGNPKSEQERFAEFKKTLQTEPYRTALKKAPLGVIQNKRSKYSFWMLRMGLYSLYWRMKR